MKTNVEQEKIWAYDKSVWLIVHKMNKAPRQWWSGTFEILSEGFDDKLKLKNEVWARMQH